MKLLARIGDNFEFIDEDKSDTLGIYEGPWQLFHLRNIDPSLVLAEPEKNTARDSHTRWVDQSIYDSWDFPIDDMQWLKKHRRSA